MRARDADGERPVLIVHPSNDLYGSDRMAAESAAALAEDSPVVLLVPSAGPLAQITTDRIDVRVRPFAALRKSDARTLSGRALLVLRLGSVDVLRAVRELRRIRPVAVYVNTVICPQWIVAGRLLRLPVVTHVHEIEQGLAAPLQSLLLAAPTRSTVVVANSRATATWITAVRPRAAGRLHVVYNGVARPAPPAAQTTPAARPPTAVVVGRLSERKGQLVALRAFAEVVARFPDARLVLVGQEFGGPGAFTRTLESEVTRLCLDDHVEFAGQTDDPWVHFDQADVVLVPSLQEPFGNVAVEAGLAGKPVIASDVEGLAEVVETGRTGWLIPPQDPHALARTLVDVFADPGRAARVGETARRRMTERFAPEAYLRSIRELVRSARR